MAEEREQPARSSTSGLTAAAAPVPIADLSAESARPVATGVLELDRVLGGGLVPGSVTLVGGEPGIGKSTLLLDAAARWAAAGRRALYVSAEESVQQVRRRAERLGAVVDGLWLGAETELAAVLSGVEQIQPSLLIVDSIQTVFDPELGSAPGSVVQVRECAHALVRLAKATGLSVVLVGHVTKDGSLAGPRVLEHVVDTVVSFEGERHHALRLLRTSKHRFGPTSELGVLEMSDAGLLPVSDPSGRFLGDRCLGVPGSIVVPTMEGQRPLMVELQALVSHTTMNNPRRSAQGIEPGRLAMLLAVLDRRAGCPTFDHEVFASVAGGVRVADPGCDLGLALAIASSRRDRPVAHDLVAIGEVGLGGELRSVGQLDRRISEAARLGFNYALVPASAPEAGHEIDVIRVPSLAAALERCGLNESAG